MIRNIFYFVYVPHYTKNLKEICRNVLSSINDANRVCLESNIKFQIWNEYMDGFCFWLKGSHFVPLYNLNATFSTRIQTHTKYVVNHI